MTDERIANLLLSELSSTREEKCHLQEQVDSLLLQMASLRQMIEDMTASHKMANDTLLMTVADLNKKIDMLTADLADRDAEIESLRLQLRLNRGKRFSPTAEQARFLNNRTGAKDREDEKDRFDGSGLQQDASASDSHSTAGSAPNSSASPKKHKAGRRSLYAPEPDGCAHVDAVITHRLEDYYSLPEGAHFLKRNGKTDIFYYTEIRYIKARVEKHVYEVASVAMPDNIIMQTMDTPHVAGRCPFDASMLAFVLVQKYVYNSPINTVKKMLRDAGANFSKSVLGRYYHQGMQALMDTLKDTLKEEVRTARYLMIDETAELVGVTDGDTGDRSYRKKYLWAFFDKVHKLVMYVYEKGSRSRRVVLDFLKGFCGCISTDGYVAYSIFDDEGTYPGVLRCGCWTHARRLFVEALESQRTECTMVINEIAELFSVELKAKVCNMTEAGRQILRKTESVPVLARILKHVYRLSKDRIIMANPLMKKAVDYMLNQWTALKNYIRNGLAEISNNLCEQRIKTIKLTLKNCQNIGSEEAAERAAFTHSLLECCILNKVNPYDYLLDIFTRIKYGSVGNKKLILPCFWQNKC